MDGKIQLRLTKLDLRARVAWDANIPVMTPANMSTDIIPTAARASAVQPDSGNHDLSCPKCQAAEKRDLKQFQLDDLDISIKCQSCRKMSACKSWRCGCALEWHKCSLHQQRPNKCRTTNIQANTIVRPVPPQSGRKRKACSLSFPLSQQQLEDLDHARINREQRLSLLQRLGARKHIPASFLSSKLQRRFAHLVTPSPCVG